MKEQNINEEIIENTPVENEKIKNINIHITDNNNKIKLSDLCTILNSLKVAINDYYKESFKANSIMLYDISPIVTNVENGSIKINIQLQSEICISKNSKFLSKLLKLLIKKPYHINFTPIDSLTISIDIFIC